MAFYSGDQYAQLRGSHFRSRSMATRWRPGDSFNVNYARNGGDIGNRISALNSYFRSQNARPVPRQQHMDNPYGINPGSIGQYNQGQNQAQFEGRPYLGGFPDDYVSGRKVFDTSRPGWDVPSLAGPGRTSMSYGRPVYREGDQALFAHKLNPDQVRRWQAFFQSQGWKTGPAGFWTEFEINAMRSFMTMANGTPGGGMTVDVLRNRVLADVAAGRLQPGALADMLATPGAGQNALAPGGGSGTAGEILEPYTQTTVEREVQEFSASEGLAAIEALVARQVGRAPTESEVAAYIKNLNRAFRADPTVIKTVVTTDPMSGQVDTTRTVEATDVSPEGMAMAFAKEGVPAEERQQYRGMQYVDVLMKELGI